MDRDRQTDRQTEKGEAVTVEKERKIHERDRD